ncbi:MAG: LysR family transcriptional regulator [Solirubrobacteraceae bacterium]
MARTHRDPEVGEMRAFCTAVELGSLGRASRALRITQPALSKRLRLLEEAAGTQLLVRSHHGVTPTAGGQSLYMAARRMVAEAETVAQLLARIGDETAPTRLAVSPTMAESVLPTLLVEFEHQHTHHLSVELTIVVSSTVWRLVTDGLADIGIAAELHPGREPLDSSPDDHGLVVFPVCDDEVVVVVPAGHRWAALDEIPLEEFVATPMIMREPGGDSRRAVEETLAERGLKPAPAVAEIGSNAAAKAAIRADGVPGLLSRLTVTSNDEDLVVRTVQGLRFPRRFVLIYVSEPDGHPSSTALIEHIRERLASGWKPLG